MRSEPVPFLDLVAPHMPIKDQLLAVLDAAISTGHFVGGAAVENFEKEFAAFTGTTYCIGVNSGTDALRFILMAAAIKQGSLVITVPNTFIATTEAISQAGGIPFFVDVDPKTYNISADLVSAFLEKECLFDKVTGETVHRSSGRTVSAILPVHLYGQPADMDVLQALAEKYNLQLFEDACQAHGSDYFSRKHNKWLRAGTLSKAAAFSFYPGKNLGALGEGGAVTTDDPVLADKIKLLREHGSKVKYYHPIEGYNGRLDSLQAGFLSAKLVLLQQWNDARRAHAQTYNRLLAGIGGVNTPFEPEWTRSNYHLYIIRSEHRDALQKFLTEAGIGTGLHYPLPLHQQEAYKHLNHHTGDFPVAETTALKILSLPMFPTLTEEQQKRVAGTINLFFEVHTGTAQ